MNRHEAMSRALGTEILSETTLSGGCISHAVKLETRSGTFFAKWGDDPIFTAEAMALETMRASNTSLVIPKPIAWSDDPPFLIEELLEPGARTKDFDERLGRGLAELHRASADAFGFHVDTFCGGTIQPNAWKKSWSDFYGEQRLGPLLRRVSGVKATERLLERLPEIVGPEEPPALIHGDLWSGNLHVAPDGRPALIDPATYFAHREAELGMMTLFGGFGARVFAAYEEIFPLAPGWRERNPLYQLYHLANHAVLFGGGYTSQTMSLVTRFIR
jgi:protein-ribulosamine 3-kinase